VVIKSSTKPNDFSGFLKKFSFQLAVNNAKKSDAQKLIII
jgi:hypothetical protein